MPIRSRVDTRYRGHGWFVIIRAQRMDSQVSTMNQRIKMYHGGESTIFSLAMINRRKINQNLKTFNVPHRLDKGKKLIGCTFDGEPIN